MNTKRFQECNKLVQIWRYRYYLYIPFRVILQLIRNRSFSNVKLIWQLAIGEAQYDMKWYYTSDEVFEKFKNKNKS